MDSTISHGATCCPNNSMPTIWLAPPKTMALIRKASNTEKPLSTAMAPNSNANGADATTTGIAEPHTGPEIALRAVFGDSFSRHDLSLTKGLM